MEAISVVIPTYNRRHSIVRSVESVLRQTCPVQEVIIADDCSQDDTQEVLKQIQDDRVRYYRLPKNRGAGGARNFGVEKAQFDLIAFHDSDDVWTEDKIQKQMAYREAHPDCGLIYSAYAMALWSGRHVVPDLERTEGLEGRILPQLLVQNTVGAPTVLMPKAVFMEVEGFDESMGSLEDWDLAIKVAKRYPIGFVPEVLLEVAVSEGSVSSDMGAYYQNRCYMMRKHLEAYLETGVLKRAVQVVLALAERDGVLPQVAKLLQHYIEGI